MARVTGGGQEEMRRLAGRLKTADAELRRQLRKALRDAAGPVTGAVREAIAASPSKHDGTLRGETARTVSASVSVAGSRVTLAIVSRGSLMPDGKGNLPAYLNDDKRWKHPVFGRPLAEIEAQVTGKGHGRGWTWVKQSSHAVGWFDKTIAGRAPDLRRSVESAMDETARKLEGG